MKARPTVNPGAKRLPTLAEVEAGVVVEYRELARQELARRLQQLADQTGELFPPAPAQTPKADAPHGTRRGGLDGGLRPATHDGPMA